MNEARKKRKDPRILLNAKELFVNIKRTKTSIDTQKKGKLVKIFEREIERQPEEERESERQTEKERERER